MKKSVLLLSLFGFIHFASAQELQIIQGYCKDENGKAIENVSVYVHDSLLISVTDKQGRFTYGFAKEGMKLRFAHMVFEPTYYTIKEKNINGKNLTVRMKTRSHELLEVTVTANTPHITFDNPVMSVIDYTLSEDGIYLIVYRRRNSALLHLSFDGDTLNELPISSRYKHLNKDAFGDIYALNVAHDFPRQILHDFGRHRQRLHHRTIFLLQQGNGLLPPSIGQRQRARTAPLHRG